MTDVATQAASSQDNVTAALLIGAFGAGLMLGVSIPLYSAPLVTGVIPVELSDTERVGSILQKTSPMNIDLRIVPPEDIAAERGKAIYGYAQYRVGSIPLCRIIIPAGTSIIAYPSISRAVWMDPFDGDAIAHEILHCMRGSWHP